MFTNPLFKFLGIVALVASLGLFGVGCEEDAGDNFEDAGESMQEGTENLADDMEEGAEDAADEAEEAID